MIGVFDSGVGGLSVLRHIRDALPYEDILYFADSGFAPYGDKPEEVVTARTLAIANFLLSRGAKALVVACNTATASAIHTLRDLYPELPIVGVEPGLKPAATLSKSRIVGVLATENTLASNKFHRLREQLSSTTGVQFLLQACRGLADQIEKGEIHANASTTIALVQRYVHPLVQQGADTLVLGCTHYPFVQLLIKQAASPNITLIDTGYAVAQQLARLITQKDLRRTATELGQTTAYTTGDQAILEMTFNALLNMQPTATQTVAIHHRPVASYQSR